jgi:REP element-mobilizing transposase RayT
MNRGVERRTIYCDDADRRMFLTLLERSISKYGWRLHAYVLMSNHYHLLFETPDANLSRGIRDLNGDYASAFNMHHARVGHLFQGRFASHLIDSEAYLLEVSRYIVLNPVRAQMVSQAEEWPWSSYQATAGLVDAPSWLDINEILIRLHPLDRALAHERYRKFVTAGVGQAESPWENLVGQAFLGGDEFLKKVEEKVRSRTWSREHPREQSRYRRCAIDDVRPALATIDATNPWPPPVSTDARSAFVVIAHRNTNATNSEIGRHLGITGQAVGKLLRKSQTRLIGDSSFAELVTAAERSLRD